MNRHRIAVAVALVAVLVAGGVYAKKRGKTEPNPIRYETGTVDRGPIVAKVMATGTLSALVTVQVGSQVSGRILELLVDYNSEVRRGQVLARLDPQLFRAALEQAQANHIAAEGELAAARITADNADRQRARAEELSGRHLIAPQELDTARATAEAARAQVAALEGRLAQTRAALSQARVNLGYTTITSPIDGIVVSRSVDVGQTVAASFQAPTLFVLAEDLRKMQVDTSVPEADIGRIRTGMEATFRVDAYPSKRFVGRVRQVRNAPQTVQNVITYDAVVDVDNPDLELRPGMTANVTFVHDHRTEALRVPNAALRFRPSPEVLAAMGRPEDGGRRRDEGPSDRRTVYVLRGNRPTAVEIRIGITDGSTTEVLEGGLRERDRVVTDATAQGAGGNGTRPAGAMGGGGRRLF